LCACASRARATAFWLALIVLPFAVHTLGPRVIQALCTPACLLTRKPPSARLMFHCARMLAQAQGDHVARASTTMEPLPKSNGAYGNPVPDMFGAYGKAVSAACKHAGQEAVRAALPTFLRLPGLPQQGLWQPPAGPGLPTRAPPVGPNWLCCCLSRAWPCCCLTGPTAASLALLLPL